MGLEVLPRCLACGLDEPRPRAGGCARHFLARGPAGLPGGDHGAVGGLDFAEALLGRQDIKEGTLARTFDNLTDLSAYEEEVEDTMHMGMDSFMRIAERFLG